MTPLNDTRHSYLKAKGISLSFQIIDRIIRTGWMASSPPAANDQGEG